MLTAFQSKLIADTGISTGDEGKGRVILEIIDELREATGRNDAVAAVMKVNGGSNSGHTVAGLKLNLLPGGVADDKVPYLLIGAAVFDALEGPNNERAFEALNVTRGQRPLPMLGRIQARTVIVSPP